MKEIVVEIVVEMVDVVPPHQVWLDPSEVEEAEDRHQDEHRLHEGGVVYQPGGG